jgi:putative hydrolase of the HAD superfamily
LSLDFIIFDLDDTLYPRDTGLMQEIGRRIHVWVCEHLGTSWEEAVALRRDYFRRYGTTLGGLMDRHGVAPEGYLTFVHDIPVEEYLEPNPALVSMLDALPLRRAVYTNATSEYARRVLGAIGVDGQFERVFGIQEVGLCTKASRDGYECVLALLCARGPECIMVEDTVSNLRAAQALGMTTVLVDGDPAPWVDFAVANVLDVEAVVDALLRPA